MLPGTILRARGDRALPREADEGDAREEVPLGFSTSVLHAFLAPPFFPRRNRSTLTMAAKQLPPAARPSTSGRLLLPPELPSAAFLLLGFTADRALDALLVGETIRSPFHEDARCQMAPPAAYLALPRRPRKEEVLLRPRSRTLSRPVPDLPAPRQDQGQDPRSPSSPFPALIPQQIAPQIQGWNQQGDQGQDQGWDQALEVWNLPSPPFSLLLP